VPTSNQELQPLVIVIASLLFVGVFGVVLYRLRKRRRRVAES